MNIKKDDGYTPLHLASLNDHLDVVTALADLVSLRANYMYEYSAITDTSLRTMGTLHSFLYCNCKESGTTLVN